MDMPILRSLAKEHLLPFFSGAELGGNPATSSSREECVALVDPCTIAFKVQRADNYRLRLRRSQPFAKLRTQRVTEKHVVEAFASVVREIEPGLSTTYRADLLSTFQRRVVAHAVAGDATSRATILGALDQLAAWASRLYEGRSIAGALGFAPGVKGSGPSLQEICEKDFSSVLSNGFDTLLTFDFYGKLLGYDALPDNTLVAPAGPGTPSPVSRSSFAPHRQGPIADWAKEGRIVLSLNRLGEILVFKDRRLLFARRSGRWHFLTHAPVLTQMGRDAAYVGRSVYESCLDASFARSGACIGIVAQRHMHEWEKVAPFEDDYLDEPKSVKAKTVASMLSGARFQKLDRRLRQELLAIDGATVLSYGGRILAVGAILKIDGGSTGGGRLAAAKALSALGVGIKVSQDGGITGYVDGGNDPKFTVM